MAANDLKQPLGQTQAGQTQKSPLLTAKRFMLASLSLFLILVLGLIAWIVFTDTPNGGYPMKVVALSEKTGGQTMIGIDGIRPGIKPGVPEALSSAVRRQPSSDNDIMGNQNGADIKILDPSDPSLNNPAGFSDKAFDKYARQVNSEAIAGLPKIAIIVDGLGLSQTTTQEALSLLPPDISLAFAPYGNGLDRWTRRARTQGHELLLQVPMEPFDYPNNDPGPHTLLTSASGEENRENLDWLLSRFDAYIGIMNYMGARFTADELSGGDLVRELSDRGLAYIDNGASGRSRMNDIANSQNVPNLRADYIIDARGRSQDIETRLTQLETLAQEKGKALGIATAFPISVRTIATWTQNLRQRGFALVPVTTLLKE
ncbi:MAG: divergent polysaccharide deacetylase family protein [Cohaesibacter sp.]|nr:divergent polysaccharide deacetylase family protein [Cohaesibacter sp.]